MGTNNRRSIASRVGVLMVAALVASVGYAAADEWDWSIAPYLWLSDASVDVNVNGTDLIDNKTDFNNILDDADFALMFHAEGRKGRGGLLLDFITVDLGDDLRHYAQGITAESDLELTILEVGGTYSTTEEREGFDLLFGVRMTDADQEIRIMTPPPLNGSERVEASETLYDGFVGARYTAGFGNGWSLTVRGDMASGGTNFTWNAIAGLGLR